ncbi:phosphotransferase [Rubrobacter tropicus]|uniref:Phosphotransferase n=1 Tax=Rubrobacter tropicus TaxID=2653851 RepID=A0A6G8QEL6_9ACTN|nr:phosphotransferase [Rubrobacter tropicus]QIN84945.1 phosphotransferase [Rubrobacter tropicus]
MERFNPPPAEGVRLHWSEAPRHVREAVEAWLGGRIVAATSSPGGFSPGVAARLRTSDGRRVFVKAAGPEPNPDTPAAHRREAEVVAALPPGVPAPRLLWSHDEGEEGWIVLAFEDVEGRNPAEPWRPEELDRVLHTLAVLADVLDPSPLPDGTVEGAGGWSVVAGRHWEKLSRESPARLDEWSVRHLDELAGLEADAPEAATGSSLLHLDLRADNLLLTPHRVVVVDWPHARVGAPWVDLAFFAPSVAMQGGPTPDELFSRYPRAFQADEDAIVAVVAAITGFFIREGLQPPPPGLPTLRAFQLAQGEAARSWLASKTGWK